MSRAAHVCPSPGCSEIVISSQRYCERCSQERARSDNKKRGKENRKIYDRNWRKIREEHLRLYPFCVDCGKLANEVDHDIPIKQGGSNEHSNLESRCKSCHSRKTALFDGGFGNARKSKKA